MNVVNLGLINRHFGERLADTGHAVELYPSFAKLTLGVANRSRDAVAYLALERGEGS